MLERIEIWRCLRGATPWRAGWSRDVPWGQPFEEERLPMRLAKYTNPQRTAMPIGEATAQRTAKKTLRRGGSGYWPRRFRNPHCPARVPMYPATATNSARRAEDGANTRPLIGTSRVVRKLATAIPSGFLGSGWPTTAARRRPLTPREKAISAASTSLVRAPPAVTPSASVNSTPSPLRCERSPGLARPSRSLRPAGSCSSSLAPTL